MGIGTLAKAWKRENSVRPVRTLRLWRRTTRRWVSRPQKEKVKKKAMATSFRQIPLALSFLRYHLPKVLWRSCSKSLSRRFQSHIRSAALAFIELIRLHLHEEKKK